jgi:hypothetical protein
MARSSGVNEIMIQTPFDVAIDDPGIRAITVPRHGSYKFDSWDGKWCSKERRCGVAEIAPRVDAMFNVTWESRFHAAANAGEGNHPATRTCDWLYHNITIDGASRIMPCCMAPDKQDKRLVFETLSGSAGMDGDPVNSAMARLARLSFQDRAAYEAEAATVSSAQHPYCAKCEETPMPYGLANVAADIRALDEKGIVPRPLQWALIHWA